MRREGTGVARLTVERLMRTMGLQGVVRAKPVKTRTSYTATPCPLVDHVRRDFQVPQPNRVWVFVLTCVATLQGFVKVALSSIHSLAASLAGLTENAPALSAFIDLFLHTAVVAASAKRRSSVHRLAPWSAATARCSASAVRRLRLICSTKRAAVAK